MDFTSDIHETGSFGQFDENQACRKQTSDTSFKAPPLPLR